MPGLVAEHLGRQTQTFNMKQGYEMRLETLQNYLSVLKRVKKSGVWKLDREITMGDIDNEICNTDYLIRLLENIIKTDFKSLSCDEFFRTNLGINGARMYQILNNGTRLREEEKRQVILFIHSQ